MREIEIKLRISSVSQLQKILEEKGCVFSHLVEQEDIVYTKDVGSLEVFLSNTEFLRIRIQSDGKKFLTFKRGKTGLGLDKLEYEFEISDKEACEQFILAIGYKKAVRNFKKRIKTLYHDFEICIDEVENLGSFAEFEKSIADDGNADDAFQDIEALIQSFGLSLETQVKEGYDILLLKKQPI